MKPLKTKVSITLDSDIITKVKVLAENDDRSFSQYINLVLKEHISSQSDQNNEKQGGHIRYSYLDIPSLIIIC